MHIFPTAPFNPKKHIANLTKLTKRQKELARFLVECRRREDIADYYNISIKGVDWHIYRLFKAVGVSTLPELVIVLTEANHYSRATFMLPDAPKRLLLKAPDFCNTRVTNNNHNGQPLSG